MQCLYWHTSRVQYLSYNAFGKQFTLVYIAFESKAQDDIVYFTACKAAVLESQSFLQTEANVHGANSTKHGTLVYIRMSH